LNIDPRNGIMIAATAVPTIHDTRNPTVDHLRDKVALITGASRGIGAATARYFAEAGCHVVLVARSAETLDSLTASLSTAPGKTRSVLGSVADYAVLDEAVAVAVREFGGPDFVVNNAGLIDPIARIADSDPQAWKQVIDVNVTGAYNAMRAALPPMIERGRGVIVNLSSGAATSALEGWSHYCASKAALLSLTRVAHLEYGDSGVRVVGISPGTVATQMQDDIRESGINPVSQLPTSAHIPAEWVARAIGYLCGPEGEQYAGTDFSLKNNEGRRAAGLPLMGDG
jgi:NAD(P)-dependent dehydrogenase (short-subunit alcohol dehydrogenase family)